MNENPDSSPEPLVMNWAHVAHQIDDFIEVTRAILARLMAEGFNEEQARQIVVAIFTHCSGEGAPDA